MIAKPPHYLVAGLGSIGQRHIRNLRRLVPHAEISVLRRSASKPVENCGWDRVFISLEDALSPPPDAAIIAGPASTHLELALALAQAGIPMLIEKPLALELAGLDELLKICEEAALPVSIGYNLRFHPVLAGMAERLAAGHLGRVLRARAEVGQFLPDWRPGSDYREGVSAQKVLGGGPLLELSHEFDYLYALFGMPDAVTCRSGRFSQLEIDVDDVATTILEYKEPSMLVTVDMDFLQRPAARKCKIVCEAGLLEADFLAASITETAHDGGAVAVHKFEVSDPNDMYLEELKAFVRSCADGRPVVSLADGVDVMKIIDAAERSVKEARTIVLAGKCPQ